MASAAALALAHLVVLTLFSFCIYRQLYSNVSIIARMQYFHLPQVHPVCGDQTRDTGTLLTRSQPLVTRDRGSVTCHVTGALCHVACVTPESVSGAVKLQCSPASHGNYHLLRAVITSLLPVTTRCTRPGQIVQIILRRAQNSNHDIRELVLKRDPQSFVCPKRISAP